MSTLLFSRIQRRMSQFSALSTTKQSYRSRRSTILHDDINWHKSRHRMHRPPKISELSTSEPAFSKDSTIKVDPPLVNFQDHAHYNFDIVSFNLLAPVYKRLTSRSYGRRDREATKDKLWQERLEQTIEFFEQEIYKDTAIIALQEYWLDARYRDIFEEQFRANGYEYRIMQRAGTKVDAVALVIKTDVFDILGVENVDLCAMGDRVALLAWLRHKETGLDLLVANTHLSFPHNVFDRLNQVAQMKHLTGVIDWFSATHKIQQAPVLIMGDFNVEGHSPVCDHLRSAGYYSCFEVCPPANSTLLPHGIVEDGPVLIGVEQKELTSEVFHGTEVGSKMLEVLPTIGDETSPVAPPSSAKNAGSPCVECDDVGDDCLDPSDVGTVVDSADNAAKAAESAKSPMSNPDMQSNPYALRHIQSDAQQLAHVSYVSHFNHRSEELGVDHIFLKPNSIGGFNESASDENGELIPKRPNGVTTQQAACKPEGDSNESIAVGAEKEGENNDQPSPEVSLEAYSSHVFEGASGVGSSFLEENSAAKRPPKSEDSTRVYVAECQVLPTSLHCTSWAHQFVISDHRPVRTKIIFTKPVQGEINNE